MHNFSNSPSLMQSYSKVPCITSQCIYIGTVPCVTLQKYFHLVLCTVHIQDIIVSWRSVQAFANDPLHIQIRQEYFIKLVKYKFQRGWFIQFEIQYQLRQSALRPLGTGPLLVLAQPHCGTLFLQISGLSRVFRVSSRRKRPFYFVWHLPNEPITL